ncbi:MAG: carboxypeptidase regulatory-like domain-containing protein [Labilithrix sp.]|nr:carboxypeptidase regulatory-like domain-containing protein [Labilithrix sp.]MCW5815203.1 carboxypeptidase regulatory-like domain-containing protein [Labilithrix sp.]
MSSLKVAAAVAVAALVVALPAPATADEVDRCVAASEKGQKDRRAGRLLDARSAFLVCASEKCPAIVRSTCAEWTEQALAAIPSVVVAVVDPDRRDVVDARVSIDGKEVALGRAVNLDPGPHSVAVEASGFEAHAQPIVAREGERGRSVVVVLARRPEKQEPPALAPQRESNVPTLTWVAGGLAVAALGSFAFFGSTGRARAGELRDTCSPACAESERDAVRTRYIVADVSLIAAVVFGGLGVWSYLRAAESR